MSEAGWTRSSDILTIWVAARSDVGRVKSGSRKRQKGMRVSRRGTRENTR